MNTTELTEHDITVLMDIIDCVQINIPFVRNVEENNTIELPQAKWVLDIFNAYKDGKDWAEYFLTKFDPHHWYTARKASREINNLLDCFVFYGNLLPYLRKRGQLEGLCKFDGGVWVYDVEGIAKEYSAGTIKYRPR